jgi:Kef-type K+ transport system membrane component KefB
MRCPTPSLPSSWKVQVFTGTLILGLAVSQVAGATLDHHGYELWQNIITFATMWCLSFIMINVGYEFTIDKAALGEYVFDYGVAMTAAGFPWLFVGIWFNFAMGIDIDFTDSLLIARFAAPTSAGILFSMLDAAGLKETWVFHKARILAIFDDLDTIILMIPLKILIVGLKWELSVSIGIMFVLLLLAWFKLHAFLLPYSWNWTMFYGFAVAFVCKITHYGTHHWIHGMEPIHIEVLLPAFVIGCIADTPCARHELKLQRTMSALKRESKRLASKDCDGAKNSWGSWLGSAQESPAWAHSRTDDSPCERKDVLQERDASTSKDSSVASTTPINAGELVAKKQSSTELQVDSDSANLTVDAAADTMPPSPQPISPISLIEASKALSRPPPKVIIEETPQEIESGEKADWCDSSPLGPTNAWGERQVSEEPQMNRRVGSKLSTASKRSTSSLKSTSSRASRKSLTRYGLTKEDLIAMGAVEPEPEVEPSPQETTSGGGEDESEDWEEIVCTVISIVFMLLVGMSMPALFGNNAEDNTGGLGMGTIALHVIAVSVLMVVGKMFPLLCYSDEAKISQRLALCFGMCPRGEVGASIIVISLEFGMTGPTIIVALCALAGNLVMSGMFISLVKGLLRTDASVAPKEAVKKVGPEAPLSVEDYEVVAVATQDRSAQASSDEMKSQEIS